MRWKLLRRRLSVSAPRVIVRSHLPWPLRWAVLAVALGFSAALALWAFEFGKEFAGLDRGSKQELALLRDEMATLRAAHGQAQAVANSAESLLKAEHAAQTRLAEQVKVLEQRNADLTRDLAFFEKLLPTKAGSGASAVALRGVQAAVQAPGKLHFQLLVMQAQAVRGAVEFRGRHDWILSGTQDGRAWTSTVRGEAFVLRQYQRLEGVVDYPTGVVLRQATVRVLDAAGAQISSETVRL